MRSSRSADGTRYRMGQYPLRGRARRVLRFAQCEPAGTGSAGNPHCAARPGPRLCWHARHAAAQADGHRPAVVENSSPSGGRTPRFRNRILRTPPPTSANVRFPPPGQDRRDVGTQWNPAPGSRPLGGQVAVHGGPEPGDDLHRSRNHRPVDAHVAADGPDGGALVAVGTEPLARGGEETRRAGRDPAEIGTALQSVVCLGETGEQARERFLGSSFDLFRRSLRDTMTKGRGRGHPPRHQPGRHPRP